MSAGVYSDSLRQRHTYGQNESDLRPISPYAQHESDLRPISPYAQQFRGYDGTQPAQSSSFYSHSGLMNASPQQPRTSPLGSSTLNHSSHAGHAGHVGHVGTSSTLGNPHAQFGWHRNVASPAATGSSTCSSSGSGRYISDKKGGNLPMWDNSPQSFFSFQSKSNVTRRNRVKVLFMWLAVFVLMAVSLLFFLPPSMVNHRLQSTLKEAASKASASFYTLKTPFNSPSAATISNEVLPQQQDAQQPEAHQVVTQPQNVAPQDVAYAEDPQVHVVPADTENIGQPQQAEPQPDPVQPELMHAEPAHPEVVHSEAVHSEVVHSEAVHSEPVEHIQQPEAPQAEAPAEHVEEVQHDAVPEAQPEILPEVHEIVQIPEVPQVVQQMPEL